MPTHIRRLTAPATVLALFAAGAVPCVAQALRIESFRSDPSRFPVLTATFDVLAGDGEVVDSLRPADVTLTEGTTPVPVQVSHGAPADGVAYLIVVDTSGSMRDLLPPAAEALAGFVSRLGDRDRAALISVAEQATTVVGFTADRANLATALRALTAVGRRTELFYGLYGGLDQLSAPGLPTRRVVLLVSDGRNEGRDYTIDDCLKRATDLSATIVGFGIDLGAQGLPAPLSVQRLATMSGGLYVKVEPGQSWDDKLALAQRFVQARATVSWTSTLPQDGKPHQVTLRVRSGDIVRDRSFTVTTPLAVVPFWSRTWSGLPYWALAAIAGVVLIGLAAGVAVGVRRSRRKLRAIEQALEDERARTAEEKQGLDRKLGEMQARIEDAGRQPSATPSVPGPGPALSPADKRRTVYQPGGAPSGVEAYRAAAVRVETGVLAGSRLPLLDGRTTLGRDDDNNVVLEDEKVSLHHAAITARGGVYWLEDLGSTNGSYLLDGTRVGPGGVPLRTGQQFKLGNVVFTFEGEG